MKDTGNLNKEYRKVYQTMCGECEELCVSKNRQV